MLHGFFHEKKAFGRRGHRPVRSLFFPQQHSGHRHLRGRQRRESLNPHGIVHGGCLAALADSVGGWTASSAQHRTCVTVNYAFHFLRPAMGTNQKIRCRATPEKTGRTLSVYHVSLTDDEGLEVATGNFTFFMMDKRLNGTTPERLEHTADES